MKAGDRVQWFPSGEMGTITHVSLTLVYVSEDADPSEGGRVIAKSRFDAPEGSEFWARVISPEPTPDNKVALTLAELVTNKAYNVGVMAGTLDRIEWQALNYITRNHKATEAQLRNVLMDIVESIRSARGTIRADQRLHAEYEDATGNVLPPTIK